MSLSKDRNSQPVWQLVVELLGKIFFQLSNLNLWNCNVWWLSLLCSLVLPTGIWWWCPDNCPSNSCRQLLNHPLVSSSPNLPCSAPSASLRRVCAVGTLPRCPFVGPFPLSLRPSRTEGLLGLPHHVLPLFCCHGPPNAAQWAISFVPREGSVSQPGVL